MASLKVLPLAAATLFSVGAIAATDDMVSRSELNKIVAAAVEKALNERQEKLNAVMADKKAVEEKPVYGEVSDLNVQPEAKEKPVQEDPNRVVFSGYARYGAHYQADDLKYVGVDGSFNGASSLGRLGNEGNGGEFQVTKFFRSEQGAIWDVNVMIDHWGDEVNLKKSYAGVTQVLDSQPNAYIWAGRDFHQRLQQGINDYMVMNYDGQGAGIKNLELGSTKLELGVVSAVEWCDPRLISDNNNPNPSRVTCTGGGGVGDSGHYALTSKLYNIDLGVADLELYGNYGFDSKAIDKDERLNAWQSALVLGRGWEQGYNRLIVRYSNHADNSVYWKTEDLTTIFVSAEGSVNFSEKTAVEYLLAYHDFHIDGNEEDNRTNYGVIVRPMYFWNDVHSTWLETGYQIVDYSEGDRNSGWKATLSQNISIGMGPSFRPMLRFYITTGEVDNKRNKNILTNDDTRLNALNIGAMWEAWW